MTNRVGAGWRVIVIVLLAICAVCKTSQVREPPDLLSDDLDAGVGVGVDGGVDGATDAGTEDGGAEGEEADAGEDEEGQPGIDLRDM